MLQHYKLSLHQWWNFTKNANKGMGQLYRGIFHLSPIVANFLSERNNIGSRLKGETLP